MSPPTPTAAPSDTAQQPFVYSGRPLRVYFDIKHIPLEALPALAWDIGRGGGLISENPSCADVLVVDPAYPRGFEDFLNARLADQRPPVVFTFWVPLCALSRRLIWFGHPHWGSVVLPYGTPMHPIISVGVLAYGLFMAGRNCAELVPACELPGRTPRLIADAILASSEYVAQGSSVNSEPSASISAHSLVNGAVSTVSAPEPASSSNPIAPAPVVLVSSPAGSKRPDFGPEIATASGSKWKGPVDRLNRASKTQRVLQSTNGSSPQPDIIEASSHQEPVAPAAQPQVEETVGGGLNGVTVLVPNEAPRVPTNGGYSYVLPPVANATLAQPSSNQLNLAPKPIENGNSHPNGSTTSGTEPMRTNGHLIATTESTTNVLSPARPVTPASTSPTLSVSREKETIVPTFIANNSLDITASGSDHNSSIAVPTPISQRIPSSTAPVAITDRTRFLSAEGPRVIPKSREFGLCTTNGTNGKGKEKSASKQSTQAPTATPLQSTSLIDPKTTNRPQFLAQPALAPLAESSPPPSPPGTPPNLKYRMEWVEEDDKFLVDYMNWYFKKWPNAPTDDILDDIIKMIPRHPPDTWRYRFRSRESDYYAFKVPELMRRMVNRTSRVNPKGPRTDDPDKALPAPPVESILRRERNEMDYTESTDEDGPYLSSSSSDDDFVEGSQRKKRTRSEKYQEKKRPRHTM
ncbi:hypothetical protein FRC12_004422 [Ceratobasidium sp. 428]|nr:hypothetical protein FRC12_004422 [Ceratobasidium sp. 428]